MWNIFKKKEKITWEIRTDKIKISGEGIPTKEQLKKMLDTFVHEVETNGLKTTIKTPEVKFIVKGGDLVGVLKNNRARQNKIR